MATCKDCVHFEACRSIYEIHGDGLSEESCGCDHFSNRSRSVKLPCKVSDRLYVPIPKSKYIAEYVVIAFWIEESGTIIRIVDTRFFTVSVLFVRDIGTKAFLTREEAEEALRKGDHIEFS